uniref:Transposon protein, putative, CACTA, En/Spm sub-class n=1 Tax=Oryza sativa subsp. japonica TaxID=39947 RepID=Q2QUJ3_ORYSJ|nr:transposon protein, putative, CACTA, En/Spm sub-class [Oryza sativa Japonica Group]
MEGYACWVKRGEQEVTSADRSGAKNQEEEDEHDMFVPSPLGSEMVDVDHDLLQDMLRDVEDPAYNKRDSMKFRRLVSDSETPLYAGCRAKHTKLSATLDLMKLKASSGWTDKSFTQILGILKAMLPDDILTNRTRNWARARVKKNSDGTLTFPNAEDQAVYQKIRQFSQEVSSQRWDDDILTVALGNEEHRGWISGIGSDIPWKHGFPQYAWQYKKNKLTKAEKDARLKEQLMEDIRAELSSEFDEKLSRVEARIRGEHQQGNVDPADAPRVEVSPTERRSSCASTEAAEEQPPVPTAVDHTMGPIECTLVVRVTQAFTLPTAKDFGDEGLEVDSMAYFPPPAKKSKKAQSSPPQHETKKKAVGRGRGRGKVEASLLVPNKPNLGKAPSARPTAPTDFTLGMPLVGDDMLAKMGPACKELHGYYMEMSNTRRKHRETCMTGHHDRQPFLGPPSFIAVGIS